MRIKIIMKYGIVHKIEAVRKIEQCIMANMASPKEDESAVEPYLLVTMMFAGTTSRLYRCADIKSIKIGMQDNWNDKDSD